MIEMASMDAAARREKRSAPRYSVEMPVWFCSELLVFDGLAEVNGVTADVAIGGLFVRSELLEPVGTGVRLRLMVADREPVTLRGTVAWIAEEPPKGPGMGISLSQSHRAYQMLVSELAAGLEA